MIAEVVEVRAVGDERDRPLSLFARADVVELALAVKAAVRTVALIIGIVDLVRLDELVARAESFRDRDRELLLRGREARADGGHADRALAEDLVRDREHERAVDAARITDEHRIHLAQDRAKTLEVRISAHGLSLTTLAARGYH